MTPYSTRLSFLVSHLNGLCTDMRRDADQKEDKGDVREAGVLRQKTHEIATAIGHLMIARDIH
jgi:hypothetical protein